MVASLRVGTVEQKMDGDLWQKEMRIPSSRKEVGIMLVRSG